MWQALLATLFTYGVTALGAMIVFLFKKVNKGVLDAMLGFSAGVMTSASYFSLIAPAISMSEILNLGNVIVLLGFLCGGFLLFIGDKVCDRLINSKNKRVLM